MAIDFLRDQPRRASVASSHDVLYPSHNFFYRLGVRGRNDFERAIASRAMPKMTNLPLVAILGPFGGNHSLAHRTQFAPKLERRLDGTIRMATPALSLRCSARR